MKPINKTLSLAIGALCGSALLTAPAAHALDIGAFADIGYASSNEPGSPDSFAIGGLDLYSTQKLSANTTAFFEFVFENNGEAFVTDVERYSVKHTFSNALQLAAGRFHAPLGYWNSHYHHGVLIQDTPSRPGFLDFEDGNNATLPMHNVGLTATGNLSAISYELSYANSSAYDTTGGAGSGEILVPNVADQNNKKAIFGHLGYKVPGQNLNLGLSYMNNTLFEAGTNAGYGTSPGDALVEMTVIGLDGRYAVSNFDALFEYYSFDNAAQAGVGDGASHTASAYYAQLGYRFADKFKAVYRHEAVDFDTGASVDEYFNILGTAVSTTDVAALRYDVDDTNAVTLEYKTYSPDGGDSVDTTTVNWSFMMF
ncbi:MAG: hypothetical protein HY940_00480 [Gammaproteobacteria bacterium]|nr:hypothetical protein [Gammaproteobacteria bacterium]